MFVSYVTEAMTKMLAQSQNTQSSALHGKFEEITEAGGRYEPDHSCSR